ncbi:MAG: hypothetical protein AAF371_03650 [Pseudomonadota bacterium]
MLSFLESVAETLGRGPATALILLAAFAIACIPLLVWHWRGRWEAVEAEVLGVANRRTLASTTHAVAYRVLDEDKPRETPVQIDIRKRPLIPGDRITLIRNPRSGRVVRDRWDGASVPLMFAPLVAMGALALYAE